LCAVITQRFLFLLFDSHKGNNKLLPKAKGRNRHTHIETAAAAAQLFPGDKIVAIVVQAKKKLVI